ncbi:nuclear transport factor 2 family protein [Paractinoplanes lichenicola]|uniref:Nuclear transport factor 2 family protein n=1 Tax=Paractinoplanes lichenicola TaxID=2802976 RepID=A0ABS1W0R6_9ACTN|nr:nuclear transport factor 2 family protein [Actinoplanes lichenicola]MBL7260324.1 nuclear transport factor 2 family protein [Actinoplanes lichenicola]
MHPFRAAIESSDVEAALALLHEDVVFKSPAVYTPYRGRFAVAPILLAVIKVFEDFEYTHELSDEPSHALLFKARVGDMHLEGCDFLHAGPDGRIAEFTVMIRPLKGIQALATAMQSRLT